MAQDWYYAENNRREGPVDEPLFRDLIGRGVVTPDTLVWTDGMADWAPLAASPAAAFQKVAPPPVPRAAPSGAAPESRPMSRGGPGRPMGFVEAVSSCFSNYATFQGRASRSEYWYFVLFWVLVIFGSGFVSGALHSAAFGAPLTIALLLGCLLPLLAVTVRRFHDSDKSGWWILLGLVPAGGFVILIFTLLPPTPGPNSYG